MSKNNAVKALETAIEVNEAAQKKLRRVIAAKKRKSRNVAKERREQAGIARRLGHLEDLLAEIEAAGTVTSAPTAAEIRDVAGHIKAIRDLALADAMRAAGFKVIKAGLTTATELRGKVRK